ncbi:MAG: ribonuclease-3 [bacterium]|jgi:ribonuclease-3
MANIHNATIIAKLNELESKFQYQFSEKKILIQALTHKSFANENPEISKDNNERLEFLGDAVLQLVISDILMEMYPHLSEGQLSKFRAVLVSEVGLCKIASRIQLGEYVFIGKGEELSGGRNKKSILSDTLEALLAAIFLDSKKETGTSTVYNIILLFFLEEIKIAEQIFSNVDFKTDLQELVQCFKLGSLLYQLDKEEGPDHDKEFYTTVVINGETLGCGQGKSKKLSEQNAATEALKKLREVYGN